MADDKPVANENNHSDPVENGWHADGEEAQDSPEADEGSLRSFVTRHYHDQVVSGAAGQMSSADEERRQNFFQRAIAESQRMSAEVARCQRQHNSLEAELGPGNLQAWTMEHASEVTVSLPQAGPPQHPAIPEERESMDCDAPN